ncbi:hypothetical protein [Helicobacter sp. 11S02629-2]|uniref:hypothetical protein n=1 Tax=Helicobacter sp. 11S02629-2 TaxID=1476195 RepID=UPI00117A54AA|nr:hypothetical protein [Helicobacter sp. 11S02629-2]
MESPSLGHISKQDLKRLYEISLLAFAGNVKLKDFKKGMDLKEILQRDYRKDKLTRLDSKIPFGGMFIGLRDESGKYKLDKDSKPINRLLPHVESFCNRFTILEHINEYSHTFGFRASLFFDTKTKEYYLSLAGTDMSEYAFFNEVDWWDIYADMCLMAGFLPYLEFKSMLRFYSYIKQRYALDETNFYIVGHSLGGYLSQILSVAFLSEIKKGYFFQAPGAKGFHIGPFARLKLSPYEKQVLKNYFRNETSKLLESKLVNINTFRDANSKGYFQRNFVQLFGKKVACKEYELYLGRFDTHHPGCALLPICDYLKLSHN